MSHITHVELDVLRSAIKTTTTQMRQAVGGVASLGETSRDKGNGYESSHPRHHRLVAVEAIVDKFHPLFVELVQEFERRFAEADKETQP